MFNLPPSDSNLPEADLTLLPPHLRPPESTPTPEAVAQKIAQQVEGQQASGSVDIRPLWLQLLETAQSRYDQHLLPHLTELRSRLLWCVLGNILTAIGGWFACTWVFKQLQAVAPKQLVLVQLTPLDGVMLSVKLSLLLGLIGSLPLWLWHIVRFVNPGLTPKERTLLMGGLTVALGLLVLGCTFAYTVLLPTSLSVLWELSPVIATNQWNVVAYFNFCLFLTVGMGVVFQLPLVIGLLGYAGIVSSAVLLRYWRESLVALLVLAALITPTQDPFTMLLVGGVLSVLYVGSIGLLKWMKR